MIEAPGGTPTLREVPDPETPADGVLIEVHATGLCRSDWHAWAGHDDVELPYVPGHEFAGVIAAVGADVRGWRIGDRVTAPFVNGCGACEWCARGDAQVCPDQRQPGFTDAGSFAERVVVFAAETNLVRVPDDVPLSAAASLGCRFATAFRALTARARVQPGEWVVVVGAGGVGLSAVMIARALGARVVAVDRSSAARELARRVGAEATVAARVADDVAAAVVAITGGGAHVSVDAVGSERTCADAVLSLRRRGRHVQIGLLASEDGLTPVALSRAVAWELDLLGSHGMAARDYPAMLELIAGGALRPADLVSRTVGLSEGAALLPSMADQPAGGITIIDPRR